MSFYTSAHLAWSVLKHNFLLPTPLGSLKKNSQQVANANNFSLILKLGKNELVVGGKEKEMQLKRKKKKYFMNFLYIDPPLIDSD